MSSSVSYITLEEAEAEFEKLLISVRGAFGHEGRKFSEILTEIPFGGKSIRFQSIRKNGKMEQLLVHLTLQNA